jgi:hypothetical protein
MRPPNPPPFLTLESLGHLNYLRSVLAQPSGSWNGFYEPQSPSMNFALRYQLAFGVYAVAALAQRTPAYRAPYAEAIRGAIEKMLEVAAWGYWRVPAEESAAPALAQSGHLAVLASPHIRRPLGPLSDPIVRDNLQFSGHLSTMLGLYEKLTGDGRYDHSFTLADPETGASYTYTHSDVAGRIYAQQLESPIGGVYCETGMAYVPCNNHALASNALHDAVHGTRFRTANARWLRTVRRRMVLHGPAIRGIFAVCYVRALHAAAPVAFNFTDAWGLAFLLPFDRGLVRRLYPKFRRRVTRAGAEGAYLSSAPLSEKMEISDVAINSSFALIVARGMGDDELADDLAHYAKAVFGAGWDGARYLYKHASRTLHSTALYALAGAIEPGGASFARLFNSVPDRSEEAWPLLSAVSSSEGRVGVSTAYYEPAERTLHISLCQVGSAEALKDTGPQTATLTLEKITARPHIVVKGLALTEEEYRHAPDGTLTFSVRLEPQMEANCSVRVA